ncbi:uncharacterized protein LOC131946934 [Physella acuta]|uniref:uncharacterized protein LOC131946934 n=1 Tax=Physella acuta TaxID=109671 RepID=UPI0027DD403C|nr:uncharacterized protein LOC131946934 [Physella acuta]XP_059163966.1 uncharacterized protein LOC131946934 [Physella acuta]XP_059163967.1 uncharacterized protein LOC131946934 [Physella acuta]
MMSSSPLVFKHGFQRMSRFSYIHAQSWRPTTPLFMCKYNSVWLQQSQNISSMPLRKSLFDSRSCLTLSSSSSPSYEKGCIQRGTIRCNQTSSESKQLLEKIKNMEFREIYFTTSIRMFRTVCTSNKLSCLAAILGVPVSGGAALLGAIPTQTALSISSVLLLYPLIFLAPVFFISRVVAKIMISDNQEYLKMSHLTMFGQRRDIYVKPTDILPLQHHADGVFSKKMAVVKFRSSSKFLLLFPHNGSQNTDVEALEIIFSGELLNKENKKEDTE